MKFFILLFFFYYLKIISNIKIINLPFEIQNINNNNYNNDKIKLLFFNKKTIVKNIFLGSEKIFIPFNIKLSNYVISVNKNDFNFSNSKTYKNQKKLDFLLEGENGNYSIENIFIFQKSNFVLFEDCNIFLTEKNILGLSNYYYTNYYSNVNIFKLLEKYKIKKTFLFEFNNENEGNLIFGKEQKEYFNDNLYENINIYMKKREKSLNKWKIQLKNVIINNKILIDNEYEFDYFKIEIDFYFISAPLFIKDYLYENFFNNSNCEIKNFEGNNFYYFYEKNITYYYFICNEKVNLKSFPKIYFTLYNNKNCFVFNYEDLFIKSDNKYFFLMIFGTEEFIFGQPFLKKYKIIFDKENYLISLKFNKNDYYSKEILNNNKINKIDYKLIILIILLFFSIIIIIYLYYKKPRKKKANELLDDNYEYSQQNKIQNFIEFSNKN